jgi:hypothetical protein
MLPHEQLKLLIQNPAVQYLCPFTVSLFFNHFSSPLPFQQKQLQAIRFGKCFMGFLVNYLSKPAGLLPMSLLLACKSKGTRTRGELRNG